MEDNSVKQNGDKADTRIVRAAIHPALGIARLGNSQLKDGYFIGPEVTEPPLTGAGELRDAEGAIKRQAARFRIYGYDAAGKVVEELTAMTAEITWQVHLANRKAQWYQFDMAMDLPEAKGIEVPLRNADVQGAAREALAIDPGPRLICGVNSSGPDYQFDTGHFQGTPVALGELRTDEAGRLLVLGGFGSSVSPDNKPIFDPRNPSTFANAPGWYDDTSDGPVTATVKLQGREIPVESAWVVAAQPNFAPNVIGWRTLYDLLVDTYTRNGWMQEPEQVSFTRDVLPVLQRLSNLQWVNKGFAALFGHGAAFDFANHTLLAKLSCRSRAGEPDTYGQLRRTVFNAFRDADNSVHEPRTWPWLYGDTFGGDEDLPDNHLAPSGLRSRLLKRWVDADFIDDWSASHTPPRLLVEIPIAEQPAMLDKAALHFCLADAFHPGIELSWPMRHVSMYSAPWRIKSMPATDVLPDHGPMLDQKLALSPDGPLNAQPPGGLSRWMALPWQVDATGCRSGYDYKYDPYLPTFWPARVPDHVLTEADYRIVMDTSLPRQQRLAAFNQRAQWDRELTGRFADKALQMVATFGEIGVIEARTGIDNDPDFPAIMQVESLPGQSPTTRFSADQAAGPDDPELKALQLAGWESLEQFEEARRTLRR